MSSNGVPLQDISDTVGHKSTHVTETVYRHVIVPAIRGGASVMDAVDVITGADRVPLISTSSAAVREPAQRSAEPPQARDWS